MVKTPGSVFYDRLNDILDEHEFDQRMEALCRKFYKKSAYGRPSVAPRVCFRAVLIGYFEGLDSERRIAWRSADSLRRFLGYGLDEDTPDPLDNLADAATVLAGGAQTVFRWVVKFLIADGLISGQTVSIDGTTLEANGAMRSLVRRDNGQSYEEYLKGLAKAAGIENPTREQLALRWKREKKGSSQEWTSPSDPDARITKMKDGRTHLAHKAEHSVDLSSGALLAVTLQGANEGDTTTIRATLKEVQSVAQEVSQVGVEELVADKGYHSGAVLGPPSGWSSELHPGAGARPAEVAG